MEFKIKALETRAAAIESELHIIWDNMRVSLSKQDRHLLKLEDKLDQVLSELKDTNNKLNLLINHHDLNHIREKTSA